MSKVQVDKVVNLSDDGAPQLTYGAELPVGYGLTGAGGLNITGVVTAASAVFSGNVTIGGTLTYEDVTNIDVVGVSTFAGRMNVNSTIEANEGINVTAGVGTFAGNVSIADKIIHTGDTNTAIRFPAADTVSVETSGSEALRVDSNQRVIIGHTASLGEDRALQIAGTTVDTSCTQIIRYGDNDGGGKVDLTKSRAGSIGGNTIVQDGDVLGDIVFRGDDGSDLNSVGVQISANVDGTPGSNDMPGRLVFATTADGSNSATERLRITSAGRVGINETSPDNMLHVRSDGAAAAKLGGESGSAYYMEIGQLASSGSPGFNATGSSTSMLFQLNGSEKMRLNSSGFVGVGTNNPVRKLHVEDDNAEIALFQSRRADGSYVNFNVGANGASLGLIGSGAAILSGGADASDFGIRSSGDLCFSSGGHAERARFDTNGDFLIGTTTSAGKLTVDSGTSNTCATFQSSDSGAGINLKDNSARSSIEQNGTSLKIGADTGGEHANSDIRLQVDGSTKVIITSTGYMGINNTSPDTWLHIDRSDQQNDSHGTLKIENTSTDTAFNAGLTVMNYQGTSQFMQWTTSGLRMGSRIVTNTGNGHVSITRGGDTVGLTIDGGTGNFSGSSSANISDGRLKKNIVGITSATATLKQLVGKTFNWIPEAKLDTKTKYGFIAQEVKSVIPELVYQDLSINRVSTASTAQDYGKGIIIDDNSADFGDDSKSEWSMSVETNGLVPILVEAFKELDARISALESS